MNFLSRYRDSVPATDRSDVTPRAFPAAFRTAIDAPTDAPGRRFAAVTGDRTLDGHAVYRALTEIDGIADPDAPTDWSGWSRSPADRPIPESRSLDGAFETAATAFVAWYADLFDEPDEDDAWVDDRLEYEFAVATGEADTETVFEVPEYRGDGLDWHDFQPAAGGATLDAPAATEGDRGTTDHPTEHRVPTNLRFPGMPASRYWELEDENVNLASMEAGPEEFSKVALIEFALVAGTDWFQLPVEVPLGSMLRVRNLVVTDTFGQRTVVESTRERQSSSNWRAFTADLPDFDEPGLLVAPSTPVDLVSDPVERVWFGRDQSANLAFAVEAVVPDPLGDPLDRDEFTPPELSVAAVSPGGAPDDTDEHVIFRNEGDAPLSLEKWEVATGSDDSPGDDRTVYTFGDVEIPADDTLTLHTGGQAAQNSPTERYAGSGSSWFYNEDRVTVFRPTDDGRELIAFRPLAVDVDETLPQYRFATNLPDHWYPMAPEPTAGFDTDLVLALLLDADTIGDTAAAIPTPLGRLLDETVAVNDEEIARSGVEVTRRYHRSTWTDGTVHCWSGRRVTFGGGEASSGLSFDDLVDADPDASGDREDGDGS
jgi:hypothetical protein